MRYFDKTFFKFFFGLIVLLAFGLFFVVKANAAGLVNINTAGSTELQTLNGIGPSYAQRIIDYRNQNGLYQAIEDIKKVSGIGDATFLKIKDQITVGDAAQASPNETSPGDTSTTTPPTSGTETAVPDATGLSSHYSFVPISDYASGDKLKLSAGRDRLGYVGVPVVFKAVSNTNDPNTSYLWTFGDGSTARGRDAVHAYSYAGKYVVVLNATLFDNEAVSRTTVQVVEPAFSVSEASADHVSIKNNSKYEMNLYGWRLTQGRQIFDFPKDTIIPAGVTVSFPASVSGLTSAKLAEVTIAKIDDSPVATKIGAVNGQTKPPPLAQTDAKKQKKIDDISLKLSHAEKQLADLLSAPEEQKTNETPSLQSANAASAVSGASSGSWASTLKHFFGFK